MKVAALLAPLRAAGKLRSPNERGHYRTVYGALNEDSRFVRLGEGLFELRERALVNGQPTNEMAVRLGTPIPD
jgi:DNA-directed RNA polymerase delta subunit